MMNENGTSKEENEEQIVSSENHLKFFVGDHEIQIDRDCAGDGQIQGRNERKHTSNFLNAINSPL